MFGLGVQELMLILVIAMFFFGGKKLPEIAKGTGQGIRNSGAPVMAERTTRTSRPRRRGPKSPGRR